MTLALKSTIQGHVSEIRDGYAVVRDGDVTEVFNLAWYRLDKTDRSMVELRKPDGDGAA
ncbi:hypothetical protein [Alicyclobacillus ferrooxydans]|uniref:hypothetical protein n=1 Tax=Alicyclobacillus ferrooxydans TaxID=471514 RepID=UPI000B2BA426|nr:hypothetical protein [Alicyclobacillus ferrooxydans]